MATIYLRSTDGSDSDDGSTWALAKATLAAALTAAGAGGTVHVSQVHAETQASAMTLTSPGTLASPTNIICGNDGAEPPTALATTATVTTTGANAITMAGHAYCYGIIFNSGTGAVNAGFNICTSAAANEIWRFQSCSLKCIATSNTNHITLGTTRAASARFLDCLLTFGNVADQIKVDGSLWEFVGGSIAATGSVPTTLFAQANAGRAPMVSLVGVDLSAFGSGKNLVDASASNLGIYRFETCKLGASVVIATGTIASPGASIVELFNCDSGDTNYRYARHTYFGVVTSEATIVRTGGASDGTTPISRKMVSTANAKFHIPLESVPILIWNETLGSVTVTVEIVTDGVTLKDSEAWIEIDYLGTSGFPMSVRATDRVAGILTTPANQDTSTAAWTTTGLGSPVKQKLAVTFTPAEKGLIRARICLALASTTMYFCPKLGVA